MEALLLVGICLAFFLGVSFLKASVKFIWENTVRVFGVLVGVLGVGVLGVGLAALVVLLALA